MGRPLYFTPSSFFLLFSSRILSSWRLNVCHTSDEFRMHVWNVLHVARWNTERKNYAKNRCLRTIAQSSYIFATTGMYRQSKNLLNSITAISPPHVLTIWRISAHYNGWHRFGSLVHHQQISTGLALGFVKANCKNQTTFKKLSRLAPLSHNILLLGV